MNNTCRCLLCEKEYSYNEMSEEHYPARSTGNEDIVAFNVVKMFDSFMSKGIIDEINKRIRSGMSYSDATEDYFDKELAIDISLTDVHLGLSVEAAIRF